MIYQWTGEHANTLRLAKRMSPQAFAAHLGISVATVRRWGAHPTTVPREFFQGCLDTVLHKLTPDERARFETWPTVDNGHQNRRPKPTRLAYDKNDPFWTHPKTVAALASRDIAGLYRLLQHQGVSQRRIAIFTEQSQSQVSEILGGRRVAHYEVLQRICDGLGVPRGAMGLAHTADGSPATDETSDTIIERDSYPSTRDTGTAPVTTARNHGRPLAVPHHAVRVVLVKLAEAERYVLDLLARALRHDAVNEL
jgi:transcriptional regulator with XRE-family HTH domain